MLAILLLLTTITFTTAIPDSPVAILQFHLSTFQHVLKTRDTPMLLKMVPNETFDKAHLEKLYLAYQGVGMLVETAEQHGEELKGNVKFIRAHPTHPKSYQVMVTIVKDPESPTKWRMSHAEPVVAEPKSRQWREWPCLIGFIWCFGCLVLTDDCNLFGPW